MAADDLISAWTLAEAVVVLWVFALAATISGSGLSGRVMLWMLSKLPDRPFFHRLMPLVGGCLLSPITPSGNTRMAILLPVYEGMSEGLELRKGSAVVTALFAAIRDAVSAIRAGGVARIAAIGVENDTGRAERMQVEAFDWSPHFFCFPPRGSPATPGAAGPRRDRKSQRGSRNMPRPFRSGCMPGLSPTVADWPSRQPVPTSAAAAWRWRSSGSTTWMDPPPPPMTSAHFDVSVNPARLRARGVVLPAIYEEAARTAGSLFLNPVPCRIRSRGSRG